MEGPAGSSPKLTAFQMVGEFHRRFGHPIRLSPSGQWPHDQTAFRLSLIDEEVDELRDAIDLQDLVGVADALADIVYVVCGTAHCFGIDLDAVIAEVHRSNMSKLDSSGQPIYREDGKVMKAPNYEPPNIRRALGLDRG
jgi:predicted HAD superfamily Cof-like phosphohydrolase